MKKSLSCFCMLSEIILERCQEEMISGASRLSVFCSPLLFFLLPSISICGDLATLALQILKAYGIVFLAQISVIPLGFAGQCWPSLEETKAHRKPYGNVSLSVRVAYLAQWSCISLKPQDNSPRYAQPLACCIFSFLVITFAFYLVVKKPSVVHLGFYLALITDPNPVVSVFTVTRVWLLSWKWIACFMSINSLLRKGSVDPSQPQILAESTVLKGKGRSCW